MGGVMSVASCNPPAVEMRSIVKLYPDGTLALRGVDFTACSGEIHALLGENGAGKTTLMRILYGEIRPTRGTIRVFGRKVNFRNPRDAIRAGIAMVYQHFSLVPGFTVFENIFLALRAVRRMSAAEARAIVGKVVREVGLELPLDDYVDELPVGVKQRVELVKALALGARILILDEPTSVLTPLEVRQLFQILRRLKSMGVTVILITHKLREVMEVADRVTVLRRGVVAGVAKVSEVDERKLARMMIGEDVIPAVSRGKLRRHELRPLLVVDNLWVRGRHGRWAVRGVSFVLHEGEILGIAGVQGNGQRELAEAIAGIRPIDRGRIVLAGIDVTNLPPAERYKLGLAYVIDERDVGLVLDESVAFNSVLTWFRRFATGVLGRLSWRLIKSFALKVVREFDIVAPSISAPVRYLSGGNQQKLMIGRDVARGPRVLIVAEPTHGLDVAATRYVRELLLKLRDEGRAILLISSDLEEVMQLSDRVAVMHAGRILDVRRPEDYTIEELGLLMGGVVEAAKS
jgi:simple sugar transport system ATP-binding protein